MPHRCSKGHNQNFLQERWLVVKKKHRLYASLVEVLILHSTWTFQDRVTTSNMRSPKALFTQVLSTINLTNMKNSLMMTQQDLRWQSKDNFWGLYGLVLLKTLTIKLFRARRVRGKFNLQCMRFLQQWVLGSHSQTTRNSRSVYIWNIKHLSIHIIKNSKLRNQEVH